MSKIQKLIERMRNNQTNVRPVYVRQALAALAGEKLDGGDDEDED